MFFTADFRGTGSRWIPGIVIKITVPLFYFVELATSKTVHHQVDNVKKRRTCWILMKLHRLVFSHLQNNVDISIVDTTVESSCYYTSFDLY